MQCETCGRDGSLVKIQIDKAVLNVCELCSKYGKKIEEPQVFIPRSMALGVRKEEFVISNYSQIIHNARTRSNLKQEELALKLNESLTVVQAAESGKRMDLRVAKKLESFFSIKLVEVL